MHILWHSRIKILYIAFHLCPRCVCLYFAYTYIFTIQVNSPTHPNYSYVYVYFQLHARTHIHRPSCLFHTDTLDSRSQFSEMACILIALRCANSQTEKTEKTNNKNNSPKTAIYTHTLHTAIHDARYVFNNSIYV